jgi:hypothetical protein
MIVDDAGGLAGIFTEATWHGSSNAATTPPSTVRSSR